MKQSPSTQNHIPGASKMAPDDTRELARHQPCGCIICYCKNDVRCQGCGAKSCGTHDAGNIPNPVYVVPDHIADAGKMIWQPIETSPSDETVLAAFGKHVFLAQKLTDKKQHVHDDIDVSWAVYCENSDEYYYPTGWYRVIECGRCDTYFEFINSDYQPTYWMPRPKAPEQKT